MNPVRARNDGDELRETGFERGRALLGTLGELVWKRFRDVGAEKSDFWIQYAALLEGGV